VRVYVYVCVCVCVCVWRVLLGGGQARIYRTLAAAAAADTGGDGGGGALSDPVAAILGGRASVSLSHPHCAVYTRRVLRGGLESLARAALRAPHPHHHLAVDVADLQWCERASERAGLCRHTGTQMYSTYTVFVWRYCTFAIQTQTSITHIPVRCTEWAYGASHREGCVRMCACAPAGICVHTPRLTPGSWHSSRRIGRRGSVLASRYPPLCHTHSV
jgi:hypothetical protein